MKSFITLLRREWWEWRTVTIIVSVLFLLGLVVSAYSTYKISTAIVDHEHSISFHRDNDDGNAITMKIEDEESEEDDDDKDRDYYDDDSEWVSPSQLFRGGFPGRFLMSGNDSIILFGWTHMMRGTITMINIFLMLLAVFYLVDAIFKERADGSTNFYRSMPLGDERLLLSKLVFGTVGFLAFSITLALIWYAFSRFTFPSSIAQMMNENGFSLGQVAVWDFILDWLAFHLLQLIWLLPYAIYLLLVSAATRSRPLLVAIILPVITGLVWRYFTGNVVLIDSITSNMRLLAMAMSVEWGSQAGPGVGPGETIEMFGTFMPYIFSLRSLVSLIIAALLGWGTFFAYRRNMATS
ncbi:ABC transporter permease subunit [Candidatus Neomarinimicrobiota bacterium]